MKNVYHVQLFDKPTRSLFLPTIRFRRRHRVEVEGGLLCVTDRDANPNEIMARLDGRLNDLIGLLTRRRDREG